MTKGTKSKVPSRLKSGGLLLFISVIIICSIILGGTVFLILPPGEGKIVRELDFPKGRSLRRLAEELENGGVLRSARLFTLYARATGSSAKVKAGTYQFNDAMSPVKILSMLVDGEVYEKRFAVPEGYSIYQIAEMLESRGLSSKEEFLSACRDSSLLRQAGIRAKSAEGYLYPSTYNLVRISNAREMVLMMTGQFNKVYNERFSQLEQGSGLSRGEIVTLASMVEKEAMAPEEKPLIASVFHNRLKAGMPLQSDPTAVYGLRAFGGKITGRDVRRRTPYNTYQIKGLPPGPIGSPGSDAIEAVLKPAKTGYFYFVARNDGSHQFSATLEEHNRAVRQYQKGTPTEGASPQYRNERQNITGRR